jgi:NADPH:quinone reductase-like Zn-dependent oxidoreductase
MLRGFVSRRKTMGRLDGKVALITGGASGMGMVASRLFAAEGANVVLTDVADDPGEAVAAEIESSGGQAAYVHADVSDEADAEAMVKAAVDASGDSASCTTTPGSCSARTVRSPRPTSASGTRPSGSTSKVSPSGASTGCRR